MGKLIMIGIILALIYYLFIRPIKKNQSIKNSNLDKNNANDQEMIECKKCNTYVALSEAIMSDGNYYCSKECAGVK